MGSQINTIEFRRILAAKYNELSSAACNREGIAIETAADEIDRLQQQLSRDIAIRALDRITTLLNSIQTALDRLDDGLYGLCLRCEEPIPEKRLKAIPWASYCLGCQEMIDRHRAARKDDRDVLEFAA